MSPSLVALIYVLDVSDRRSPRGFEQWSGLLSCAEARGAFPWCIARCDSYDVLICCFANSGDITGNHELLLPRIIELIVQTLHLDTAVGKLDSSHGVISCVFLLDV